MQPERKIRMITSRYDEALDRIKWMETGLEQLIKRYPNDKELGGRVRTFVRALLDGEPTTADEHNCMIQYHDPGDENVEVELAELKNDPEIQSGWDTD